MKDNELLLLDNQVCFPTYAVANKIVRRYQPLLKELDLTYTQYITMMIMWEKEVIHEKELVERLYLKANTLTDLLKKLKQKGYININKDNTDKRNIIISITEEGKKLKKKAINVPKTIQEEHWLSDDEFKTFKKLLHKLLEGEWGK